MKCSVVLCVGALVALAASKPTDKLNRNHSSLTVVSSAVVTVSDPVAPSDLSRNFLPPHSVSNHKRVRRTVLSDGKKCSTGKIRIGPNCVSCALLQKQNPHACKNHNDTLASQMTTEETLPQQWSSISTPNSDSDISTSTRFNSVITIRSTSTLTTITTVFDSGFTEASIIQSTSLSTNASSNNNSLAPICLYFVAFVYLIIYLYMNDDFI